MVLFPRSAIVLIHLICRVNKQGKIDALVPLRRMTFYDPDFGRVTVPDARNDQKQLIELARRPFQIKYLLKLPTPIRDS